jgi:RNA polymerase sigma-70 factor (sigma-E family)
MGVAVEAAEPVVAQTHESSLGPTLLTIDLVFEESFDTLYSRAYGVAFQLLGVRTEAEDVAQETLARAFVHWRKVHAYPEAWVVRVASNLSIDTWRQNRRFRNAAAPDSLTPGPDAARVDLHAALRRLSRRQREVLVLRFLADLPEADVAETLGCSVGSVKVHASRGLAALRVSMGVTPEVA